MTLTFIVTCFAILGLCVGSFLNVVIYRFPKMLEAQFEGKESELTLSKPASRCGHCGHHIRWFENIPVLSYLFLRGRCSACHASIGIRYPLVELATALIFGYCAWRWDASLTTVAYVFFGSALLCLTLIDWDTTLLPDDITVPLVWIGLVCAALGWLPQVTIYASLWGAVAGYLSLWLIYWGFKLVTGREGMGYGDFKLFAAIGAWLGWQALVPVVLAASLMGLVVALIFKITQSEREGGLIPFGPSLALGAALEFLTGWQL
jgi:leader peptidase (prepilin peptidase) / N-methyltransferase